MSFVYHKYFLMETYETHTLTHSHVLTNTQHTETQTSIQAVWPIVGECLALIQAMPTRLGKQPTPIEHIYTQHCTIYTLCISVSAPDAIVLIISTPIPIALTPPSPPHPTIPVHTCMSNLKQTMLLKPKTDMNTCVQGENRIWSTKSE